MSRPTHGVASPRGRKLVLFLHIMCVGSFLGATVTMAFLSLLGIATDNPEVRRSAYLLMSIMDRTLIVPLVAASILSGVVLALRTQWGLFRHFWVMAKLVLVLGMVVFAVSTVMPWVRALADETAAGGDMALVGIVGQRLAVGAGILLTAMGVIVLLAVYKPWGAVRDSSRGKAG